MDIGKSNAVGKCLDCPFEVEDTYDALKLTKAHAKKLKHKAFVEVSRTYSYNYRDSDDIDDSDLPIKRGVK
jgi:hypothetical protein